MTRVLVVGLDGFDAVLAEKYLDELPNLKSLVSRGVHGPLESIVQPVTPPAWTAMLSGRDPGHFGFTDFFYRAGHSYTDFRLVHSRLIKVAGLHQRAAEAGLRVLLIGVPVSYPPVPLADGVCVSCFMAPSTEREITFPAPLKSEVLAATTSPYILDVAVDAGDANPDRDLLIARLREYDRQRFDIAAHLMATQPWDLSFLVCQGTDRVAHFFMRYEDTAHARHDPDPRYRHAVLEHYRYCDQRLGDLVEQAGPETVVMVVSDHGVQRLDGRVNLNEWLLRQGYLHLRERPERPVPLRQAVVDWSRTRAWSRGYGGQIYLNVRGREPAGVVTPGETEDLLTELSAGLSNLVGSDGRELGARLLRRDGVYSGPHVDTCPDLLVQFDELRHLTSDSVGHADLTTPVGGLGVDDASHASRGFWAMAGPGVAARGRFDAAHIYDLAPTILGLLGLSAPADLEGRSLLEGDEIYSDEDEAALTSRLQALYLE